MRDILGSELALAVLRTLGPVGCLTSPHIGPHWVFERHNWLRARGFKKDEIVFASDKTHVPGVVLVDDKLDNLEQWQAAHPRGVAILFDQPWNQGHTTVLRAHGWAEVVYAVRAAVARAA
jgi:5'(3')-deoxyribonucleotidase